MDHRKPFPEDISIYLQLPTEQAHIPRGTLIIGLVLFLSYQSSPDLFKKQEGLNNYIVKSKILFSSQHGFESEHWTFILLLNIYDKQAAMDNKWIFNRSLLRFKAGSEQNRLKCRLLAYCTLIHIYINTKPADGCSYMEKRHRSHNGLSYSHIKSWGYYTISSTWFRSMFTCQTKLNHIYYYYSTWFCSKATHEKVVAKTSSHDDCLCLLCSVKSAIENYLTAGGLLRCVLINPPMPLNYISIWMHL